MAKKKKINLNGAPLQEITIGTIKKNRFGWIGTLILFGIFGAFIYYLPELSKYYEAFSKGDFSLLNEIIPVPNTPVTPPDQEEQNPEQEQEPEQIVYTKYTFDTEEDITYDDVTFSKVVYENGILNFKVINPNEETYEFDHTFLELYDENDNLLNRIMLNESLEKYENIDLKYEVSSNASYFYIKNIPEEDYTYIDITVDDIGQSILTCEKENEKIVYTFSNNNLRIVNHTINYSKENTDYNMRYDEYKTLTLTYAKTNGLKSEVEENDEGLIYTLNVDYTLYGDELPDYIYFNKEKDYRIVNFEMEAMFYSCS